MSLKIAVLGRGRMGLAVQRCIDEQPDLEISGIWSHSAISQSDSSESLLSDDLPGILSNAQIAIDFTLPTVTKEVVRSAVDAKIPLLCGVSGLSEQAYQYMREMSAEIPILYDRNMSLGIAVLQNLLQLAGAVLGDDFEAVIHETHHVHKIDAPSGTALQLGEALAASRGQSFQDALHYDPNGNSRPANGQIHFEVTRHGEVAGEHTVLLQSANESLSLQHKVNDRRVFAVGAIKAARWLVQQQPGFYSMQDMIRRY